MQRPSRGYVIKIRGRGNAEAIKILGYIKKFKLRGRGDEEAIKNSNNSHLL